MAIAIGFFYCLIQWNRSYIGYDSTEEELLNEIEFLRSHLTRMEKAMIEVAFSWEGKPLLLKREILLSYLNSPAEMRF